MKKCSKCGKENIDEATFCANCGAKLDSFLNKCPKCGKDNLKNATYCASCGARLYSVSGSSSSSSSTASASSSLNSNLESKSASSSLNNKPGSKSSSSSTNSGSSNQAQDGPDKLKLCCCYVPIALFIIFIAFALVYHGCAESFPVSYGYNYDVLDSDGDGRLSFDEASQLDPSISSWEMKKAFDTGDTNNNGYLKGHEFELFYDDIKSEFEDYSSSSDNDDYKYSSSSSSSGGRDYSSGSSKHSNSLNNQEYDSSSDGYVLTCPYCGSEAVYETGGHYRCADCGSNIYNPDDLELNYQEGYM